MVTDGVKKKEMGRVLLSPWLRISNSGIKTVSDDLGE